MIFQSPVRKEVLVCHYCCNDRIIKGAEHRDSHDGVVRGQPRPPLASGITRTPLLHLRAQQSMTWSELPLYYDVSDSDLIFEAEPSVRDIEIHGSIYGKIITGKLWAHLPTCTRNCLDLQACQLTTKQRSLVFHPERLAHLYLWGPCLVSGRG